MNETKPSREWRLGAIVRRQGEALLLLSIVAFAVLWMTNSTSRPSVDPTAIPTMSPTMSPTTSPMASPMASSTPDNIFQMTISTSSPSANPTAGPTASPTTSRTPIWAKKGVGFTLREEGRKGSFSENLPKIRALHPHWAYSWGPNPPAGVPQTIKDGGIEILSNETKDGIEFVPMLWGYYPNKFEEFTDKILDPKPKIVLGYNEPDKMEQSNMSVETALEGWERLVNKMEATTGDHNSLLVSPSCAQPTGEWCRSFLQQADERGLRVDVIGVHWYGGANALAFLSTLQETYELYGNRPILVTEFAIADWKATTIEENRFSPEQALGFLQVVLPWLEDTEWILGYAWFSFETNSPPGWMSALVESSNGREVVLTPLGEYYANFRSPETIFT